MFCFHGMCRLGGEMEAYGEQQKQAQKVMDTFREVLEKYSQALMREKRLALWGLVKFLGKDDF